MALKLDDFLSKKKEPAQVLDLSKCTANSKEELKHLLEKVPEYKIRPEKVKPDEVKFREKDFTFRTPKKELRPSRKEYPFADPVPPEMRAIKLEDLSSVNIQWKMLTLLRPKTKIDEEFFTRLVELGKLRLQTEEREKRVPDSDFFRKMKNRAGVVETRIVSCTECGEEFCQGETCGLFLYEGSQRNLEGVGMEGVAGGGGSRRERGRTKRKSRKRSKSKKRRASTTHNEIKSKSRERAKSKSKERSKSTGRLNKKP